MKLRRIVLTVLFIVATTITNAQLISGDVNKPINNMYPLGASNFKLQTGAKPYVVPTFTVTPATSCGGLTTVRIHWAAGTNASSVRYFTIHGGLGYNNTAIVGERIKILNYANSFSDTFQTQSGIFTFGLHLDPYDDICGNNLGSSNLGDDVMINTSWGTASANDQNRCAVYGITILPNDNSSKLATCNIYYTKSSNCTSADGSITINGLAANTNYQIATKVNQSFGVSINSGAAGSITVGNLLTGIYPVKIKKATENCYRQFNIKIGNNTGVDCFADNQLIDPSVGVNAITNGHFGNNVATLPSIGGVMATSNYTQVSFGPSDPQDTKFALVDSTDLFFKGFASNRYEWRLRNWQYSGTSNLSQHRHLWSAMQSTGDHTGSLNQANGTAHSPGYFMLINANYASDAALTVRNINLVAGNSYYFSFWAKNMQPFMAKNKNNTQKLDTTYQPIIPRLGMAVDSIIYNFSTMSAIVEPASFTGNDTMLRGANWERFNMRFVAPITKSNANISIYNFQQGGYGNDFAIDDIEFLSLSTIGDRVWNDINKDGKQNTDEPGMANITVTLLDQNMKPLQTTVSDAFGYYQFANIIPGMGGSIFHVKFSAPSGYTFTTKATSINTIDGSDANSNGITDAFTLLPNASNISIDCGLIFEQAVLPASIGNLVWFDTNKNGVQDTNESGVANVTVNLYNTSGSIVATTITNAMGFYNFENVAVGSYRVGITQPAGTICTAKDMGSDNADSDLNTTGVNIRKTDLITLTANQQIDNVDIGLSLMQLTSSSFGDLCWQDLNTNGLQDNNEPGLSGVKVVLIAPGADNLLLTNDDTRLDSVVTDAFGIWQFTNLTASRYGVQFFPASGYTYTVKNAGTDEKMDSDINGVNGISDVIYINNNPHGLNYNLLDVGFVPSTPIANASTIGNYVWNDIDGDGIQETNEYGIAGVTIDLLNNTNVTIKSTVTDANGQYKFTQVAPSTYKIKVKNIPVGYQFTQKGQGSETTDSDVETSTGLSNTIIVTANQSIENIDAGLRQSLGFGKSSIGNYVWYDFDNDGIQDNDETGVPNVIVKLRTAGSNNIFDDTDDIVITDTTNSLGQYIFNGLIAGNYRVDVVNPLFGFGYAVAIKNNGNDNKDNDFNSAIAGVSKSDVFTITNGEDKLNIACGIVPSSTINRIGNRVWKDNNANGKQDATENYGVQGVVIQLLNVTGTALADSDPSTAGTQPYQTTSNEYGYWNLVGMANASFIPRFALLPPGYKVSPRGTTSAALDSDPNGDGRANAITVPANNYINLNIDLGLIPESNVIGDLVWDDLNGNGLQETTEPGIPNVTVTLFNADNIALGATVTDASGKYYFSNVELGTYYLKFANYPSGMQFTTKEVNKYSTTGSNVNTSTLQTDMFSFTTFGDSLHIDAGLKVTNAANVGNFVWADQNSNGIQDNNEVPMAGIVVTLKNAGTDAVIGSSDDRTISTTMTNGNGNYQFVNVAAGNNFYLQYTNNPPSSIFTDPNNGTGTNDSRPNASGITPLFNIANAANIQNQDAGIKNIGILDVKLLTFEASKVSATAAKLTWTLSENLHQGAITVYHSNDGVIFTAIATVASNPTNEYYFLHNSPSLGTNYYKISISNANTATIYSQIKNVLFSKNLEIKVYPNPAVNELNLNISNSEIKNLQYIVVNSDGQTVATGLVNNASTINVSSLAKGNYFIKIFSNNSLLAIKKITKS